MGGSARPIDAHASPEAKIALFRSLFRGREDVYARRFESRRTGAAGYLPACANAWVPGVCPRPSGKCAACPQRRWLPLTDDVIRWHLLGRDSDGRDFVAAIYPLLPDATCWLIAIDLDAPAWVEDAAAIRAVCHRWQLPVLLERSRSGRGGHIWFFFSEPTPAAVARRFAACLITSAMDDRPEIGLGTYDRFFPSQDMLPDRGFGSAIALPLQKQPREGGNSLFLDPAGRAHPDPWVLLAGTCRVDRVRVEALVREAERRQRVLDVPLPATEDGGQDPWAVPSRHRRLAPTIAESLPESIELILAEQIQIAKPGLPPALITHLLRRAAFQNPEFLRAEAMRLPVFGKARIIGCAENHPQCIRLPRGCLDDVRACLSGLGIATVVRDERCTGRPLKGRFRGRLRSDQELAARRMLAHDTGVLSAPTAFGKTAIGCWLIAARAVSTLVLVHRRGLLDQWRQRLTEFLDLPSGSVGRLGGGRRQRGGLVDVALIQGLARQDPLSLAESLGGYGHLVVDECHHVSAESFARVARSSRARFVLGLSATVLRKDGHQPIVFMQCGPLRCCISGPPRDVPTQRRTVIVRPTSFHARGPESPDARMQYQELLDQLVEDEARNRLICEDVVAAV